VRAGEEENAAPADSATRRGGRWLILPVLGYSPETRLMGGVSAFYLLPTRGGASARPSNFSGTLIYTQEKQLLAELGVDHYGAGESRHIEGALSFLRYPELFFGIGRDAPDSQEESFTPETSRFSLRFERRLRESLSAGLSCEWWRSRLTELEEDGLLAGGGIPGSDDPQVLGLGIAATWDTRDGNWFATRGSYHQVSLRFYDKSLGSDFDFRRLRVNLRRFWTPWADHVLALQAVGEFLGGTPPFQSLAGLGGGRILRGYYEGRYRDRNLLALQAEYRLPAVWRRFGLALFGGVGDVAPEPGELSLGKAKGSGGVGLRYLFSPEERMNIRIDYGVGENSTGFYITLGEAF